MINIFALLNLSFEFSPMEKVIRLLKPFSCMIVDSVKSPKNSENDNPEENFNHIPDIHFVSI